MKDLHFKIRKIRELRSYSQEYMAEKLKISVRAYGNIENGKTSLKIDRLLSICSLLNVSFEQLLHFSCNELITEGRSVNRYSVFEEELRSLREQVTRLNKELLFLRNRSLSCL